MNKTTLKQIAALIGACVVGGMAYLNMGGNDSEKQDALELGTGVSANTESPKESSVNGNTMTYGNHTYTQDGNLSIESYSSDAIGKVTFTNVPSDYTEFETVYHQFLGKTPYGTAAMMPMAMEMYGRDKEMGEKCVRLICT